MIIADKNAFAKNTHKKRCDLEKLSHIFLYSLIPKCIFYEFQIFYIFSK